MITYNNARPKLTLSTALTPVSAEFGSVEDQHACIRQWVGIAPRIVVMSEIDPPKEHGVTWLNLPGVGALQKILGYYLLQIPGRDVVVISNPNVHLDKAEITRLLEFVQGQRLDLAWAAICPVEGESVFFMSGAVVPYILSEIPQTVTFANLEWQAWLTKTLKRILAFRLVDGKAYKVAFKPVLSLPEPVMNAYDLPEQEMPANPTETALEDAPEPPVVKPKAKRGRPRKTPVNG